MENQMTFIGHLRKNAATEPDRAAFIILADSNRAERRISNQYLWIRVVQTAVSIRARIPIGDRVLLLYQDSLEFIISFLACLYSGIVSVPLPYLRIKKNVGAFKAIFENCAASAVLTTQELVEFSRHICDNLADGNAQIVSTSELTISKFEEDVADPPYCNTAFIQYTSGSTGEPKGVIVSHGNLLHNQSMIQKSFGCDDSSVIVSWLPFHHDMGLIGNILHAIYVGCTCVLMSPLQFMQHPLRWLQAISRFQATHSGGPNFSYDLCVEKITRDEVLQLNLSSWKVAFNGSEVVRSATLTRFSELFAGAGFRADAFYPCYGLAESTLLVSCWNASLPKMTISITKEMSNSDYIQLAKTGEIEARDLVSAGSPVSGVDCQICSGVDMLPCKELQTGEICISGDSVTQGYWDENNDQHLINIDGKKFFRTGDLGFFYNNQLFISGRLKEMLIIRGQNVYPYDIEIAIGQVRPEIQSNSVAVFTESESGDDAVVVVELRRRKTDFALACDILQSIDVLLTGRFGLCFSDIVILPLYAIPRTSSGKLKRMACRDLYRKKAFTPLVSKKSLFIPKVHAEHNSLLLQEVMQNMRDEDISRYLMDIFAAEAFGLPTIDDNADPDLFALGLDSLRVARLINILSNDLGIAITLAEVMENAKLSDLRDAISSRLWLTRTNTIGTTIFI